MNDPWQIPGSGVPRLAADPRRADPLAGGSSSPALDGAARAPPPPDHDLAALHVAAADIPALYHGLRAHPNFRRLLLHLDGSAHVVVSTDAAHWGSLRQLVPAAVPDPAFPLKHLAAAAAQGPNAGVAPSPVLAVRYQPYNFSRADVERLLSLFPGVVNVEVRRMIQPTPGQMPVGEAFIALSNEDFARHLLETLNQTTNWEAVYIRMSPSVTGFVDGLVSQKVSSPAASAQNPALGSSDSFSSAKNGRIPSDPFANGALGPSGPAAQAFVNPGTSTGTRLPQQLPTTPARNELTEIQVIISHPPGTAKDQAGNWVVRTVPGLENIIWVPPPGEPDGQSTAALLRFLSPQLLQNFLSQQPIQDGIFGIVVSSVPVPIISVPASTPTPSFNAIGGAPNLTQQQALPGLGRESWGIASRDGSSMRRDRSTGSGSEDRDFSRDRLAGRPQNSFNAPRNTLQLTSIPPHLDRADLRRFSRSLTGFKKIAFYRDWCFLVFVSSEAAHAAMRIVNDGTVGFLGGMRASFTKENVGLGIHRASECTKLIC